MSLPALGSFASERSRPIKQTSQIIKKREKKATFMIGWINLRSLNILLLDMSFVVSQARVDERLMAMLRSNLTKGFENSTDRAVVCACDFLV